LKIRHLSIRNFRGIRELDWALPDHPIFCLIGRGDSTKSTILEAIRCAFYPQWNLAFDDADFYACDHNNSIQIDAVATNIPDEFRDLGRYGHWLSGWNPQSHTREIDPGEGLEDALCIRLVVKSDLEPSWSVVKSDNSEGTPFKTSDRAKAAVSFIGAFADRHLTWGRGSILSQHTETANISLSLANAARAAKAALEARRAQDLKSFDAVAGTAEKTARELGVVVVSSYKAHLDTEAINVRLGGLSLHDGEVPLRQLGLGSKRMLTTGLQKQGLEAPHITLCDEFEIGLEPHRIARLVQHLKQDVSGQYFATTHSPVVLREMTIDDIQVVHCKGGKTEIVAARQPALSDIVQGKLRSGAEAFLAPKIVVCEGPTEIGFVRGLDSVWIEEGLPSFAYQGVAPFNAGGADNIRSAAECMQLLHYDVAVISDSDAPAKFSPQDVNDLKANGVTVVCWAGKVSIEERVFADLPWGGVIASFKTALQIHANEQETLDQVGSQFGPGFDRNYGAWTESQKLRTALGKAANASSWFKKQSWAHEWVVQISEHLFSPAIHTTDLAIQIVVFRKWVDNA
jgi:putative ATP-dependent endonuclease of OLD family